MTSSGEGLTLGGAKHLDGASGSQADARRNGARLLAVYAYGDDDGAQDRVQDLAALCALDKGHNFDNPRPANLEILLA